MAHELLLENARVVDGTGAPWFRGGVTVEDGTITAVSRRSRPEITAEETIDVGGDLLCPGFIDTHSHSDLKLFDSPALEPKVRQGITTEIVGQDGFSMAPMYREGGAEEWQRQLSALTGRSEREWTWGGVDAYLDAIAESGVAPNVGTLVGHGTVRFDVLGLEDREPTPAELEEMADLVSEGLDDGALGLSTGLVYTPCSYADTDEVRELAARLAPYGRPFVAHVRSEGRWIWEALDEFVGIGAEEGVPLHLSHFKLAGRKQHGKVDEARNRLRTARERGVDLTVEQYPYSSASTMLSALLPPWVQTGGPDETLERLHDPETRERIQREIEEWELPGWENYGGLCGWENVYVTNVESDANGSLEGSSLAAIAEQRDDRPHEVLCDLLIEEELGVSVRLDMMDRADVRAILQDERVNVGTDGLFGGTPHPRVYGSYPRILGRYVREENLLTVEEAVRKMTSLPARAFGLDRKGIVRPGMDADLVVFDPDVVDSPATYDDPRRYPRGIRHVIVGGTPVVADGERTEELPGETVRA